MAFSETVELLGKGLYKSKGIPDVLTISAIPTISELEYVAAEDFDKVMLEKILPEVISEKIDFSQLLEIDYQWILRCLRILNYGPYHTTNSIFCPTCGPQYGEFQVNLTSIECKTLPEGFKNDICISKNEFISYDGDVHIALPTIKQMLNAYKDELFKMANGNINRELARICYMVTRIRDEVSPTPVTVQMQIESKFTSADYMILKEKVHELTDYGIRAGGTTVCPKCNGKDASFVAFIDDRFFRPQLGDLRKWKADSCGRKGNEALRDKTKNV